MLNKEEELRLASCIDVLYNRENLTIETQLWLALKLQELQVRLVMRFEERKSNKPEEKAIINQAKQLLMAKYKLTENEAHLFIMRTATDNRTTKFQIAKKFLDSETS